MSEEKSCQGCTKSDCGDCKGDKKSSFQEEMNVFSNIKHVIAVMSGKGGVGKSTVTAALAVELTKKGHKVGILDADITGPSIPRMFGISGPADSTEQGILPTLTESGIRVMSINLLMENEEEPVIWRGPVIANMVKQFWTDILWGELDFLLVDMPPGTGDVPLTVFQSLPINGTILVSSPQDLVKMIVKKAYHMAEKMDIPIMGIIENYSYFVCPDCGKKYAIFGESKVDTAALEMGIPVLGKLPVNPESAHLADAGKFEDAGHPQLIQAVEVLEKLVNERSANA
ncbi:MAG: Mrp/NBP35 family ATP-binding protein [Lachnospiraceae bacterium]|nr:Mrp/NBP35 family ATP-binding protein [Lachnospiraceae bacterium]